MGKVSRGGSKGPKLDDVPSIRQFEELVKRLKLQAMKRPIIDYVLPLTVCLTGCRISECLQLTTTDIDYDNVVLHLVTLKGGRGAKRAIPIPTWFLAILQNYVLYNGISYKLFPISRTEAWRIIKKETGFRPHALRHAFALYMLFHGKDPETVKRLLGHSDWKMVEYYVKIVQIDKRITSPFENM